MGAGCAPPAEVDDGLAGVGRIAGEDTGTDPTAGDTCLAPGVALPPTGARGATPAGVPTPATDPTPPDTPLGAALAAAPTDVTGADVSSTPSGIPGAKIASISPDATGAAAV